MEKLNEWVGYKLIHFSTPKDAREVISTKFCSYLFLVPQIKDDEIQFDLQKRNFQKNCQNPTGSTEVFQNLAPPSLPP